MNNTSLNTLYHSLSKSGVKSLTLSNFRNYQFLKLEPKFGPIIIYGQNGSGKTNILEALSLLSPGRGLRSSKLSEIQRIGPALVQGFDDTAFSWGINANIFKNEDEYNIGTGIEKGAVYDKRIIKLNGEKISSQAELGKYISALWLTPQMDRIFNKGSSQRRSFLDRLVYAFDIEHAKRTAQFEHLYKEWVELLKRGIKDNNWLFAIEEKMACLGVAIAAARVEHVNKLNSWIEEEPESVFPSVDIKLVGIIEEMLATKKALEVEDCYKILLYNNRSRAIESSIDGIGKTDMKVTYKKKHMPAELCSTGEQKSLLITIILAQTKAQSLNQGFAPILLLDEVCAHLDEEKKEALLDKILELKIQAFITATDKEMFSSLASKAQFIEVKNNAVQIF
ncbi:MAG: DNA replication/repair protein RecF [Alphaproteobacteria bacterium]